MQKKQNLQNRVMTCATDRQKYPYQESFTDIHARTNRESLNDKQYSHVSQQSINLTSKATSHINYKELFQNQQNTKKMHLFSQQTQQTASFQHSHRNKNSQRHKSQNPLPKIMEDYLQLSIFLENDKLVSKIQCKNTKNYLELNNYKILKELENEQQFQDNPTIQLLFLLLKELDENIIKPLIQDEEVQNFENDLIDDLQGTSKKFLKERYLSNKIKFNEEKMNQFMNIIVNNIPQIQSRISQNNQIHGVITHGFYTIILFFIDYIKFSQSQIIKESISTKLESLSNQNNELQQTKQSLLQQIYQIQRQKDIETKDLTNQINQLSEQINTLMLLNQDYKKKLYEYENFDFAKIQMGQIQTSLKDFNQVVLQIQSSHTHTQDILNEGLLQLGESIMVVNSKYGQICDEKIRNNNFFNMKNENIHVSLHEHPFVFLQIYSFMHKNLPVQEDTAQEYQSKKILQQFFDYLSTQKNLISNPADIFVSFLIKKKAQDDVYVASNILELILKDITDNKNNLIFQFFSMLFGLYNTPMPQAGSVMIIIQIYQYLVDYNKQSQQNIETNSPLKPDRRKSVAPLKRKTKKSAIFLEGIMKSLESESQIQTEKQFFLEKKLVFDSQLFQGIYNIFENLQIKLTHQNLQQLTEILNSEVEVIQILLSVLIIFMQINKHSQSQTINNFIENLSNKEKKVWLNYKEYKKISEEINYDQLDLFKLIIMSYYHTIGVLRRKTKIVQCEDPLVNLKFTSLDPLQKVVKETLQSVFKLNSFQYNQTYPNEEGGGHETNQLKRTSIAINCIVKTQKLITTF